MKLPEIVTMAVYSETAKRLAGRIERDCIELLQDYIRENMGIIFGSTLLHIYDHYQGEKFFLPERVNFVVDEDDAVDIYLIGKTVSEKFGEEENSFLLEDVMHGERGRSTYQQWRKAREQA